MWRLLTNSIAVKANLARRLIDTPTDFPVCENTETSQHMLFQFDWAKRVWFSTLGVKVELSNASSVEEWFMKRWKEGEVNRTNLKERWAICAITSWLIWKERCMKVFENNTPNPSEVTKWVLASWAECSRIGASERKDPNSRRTDELD